MISFFGGCCGEENRSNDLLKKLSLCCGNLEQPNWAESYEIWASSLWKWQACEPCVAGLSKVHRELGKKLISTSNLTAILSVPSPPKKGQSGQSGCLVFFFCFIYKQSKKSDPQDPLNERTPKKPGQLIGESVQRSEGETEKKTTRGSGQGRATTLVGWRSIGLKPWSSLESSEWMGISTRNSWQV